MAGSENRVTIVIDGRNDAGAAFASATAEAEALKKILAGAWKTPDQRTAFGQTLSNAWARQGEEAGNSFWRGFFSRLKSFAVGRGDGSGGGGLLGGLLGGAGALGGLLGGAGVAGGVSWGIVGALAAVVTGLAGIVPAAVAAGMGLAAFGALAFSTFTGLQTSLTTLSTATSTYQQASLNLNQAIHNNATDMALYRTALASLDPQQRAAAQLLTNQNVQWQNLTPSMQKNVVALANNKAALRSLLPDQAAALTALMKEKAAWDALSPAQQTAARTLNAIGAAWSNMQKAIQPIALKVLNDALKGLQTILPLLLPLAQAAGTAIDGLLTSFDKFAKSAGFKTWVGEMTKLSGPAITAIGTGLGQIAIAVGKLLIAMSSPSGLKTFHLVVKGIVDVIGGIAWAFQHAGPFIKHFQSDIKQTESIINLIKKRIHETAQMLHDFAHWFDIARHAVATFGHEFAHEFDMLRHHVATDLHDIAHKFDELRHAIATAGHDIAHVFDTVRHTIATWGHDIAHTFDTVRHTIATVFNHIVTDVKNWVKNVISAGKGVLTWFQQLPGKIVGYLASLPGLLFAAGQRAIQGLIHGILSMAGAVAGAIGHIVGIITSHLPFSPAKMGPLSGAGDPLLAGREIARRLATGMSAGVPMVAGAASRMAGAAGISPGGGGAVVIHIQPGGSGLDRLFMDWLKYSIRASGGDPRILTQKVRLA